jgi:hypothetical protein
MRQPIVVVVGVLFVVALAVVNFTPLRDYLISLPAAAETESSTSLPPREILVTTTMTTADFVSERVCLDQEGPHVIEADAASGNAATGFVALLVYAWAESNWEYEDQSELFALGAGAVTAGALFWRDPPGTRPRS